MPFDQPSALRALPTRTELAARVSACQRDANRLTWRFLGAFLALVPACIFGFPWLEARGLVVWGVWLLPLGATGAMIFGYGAGLRRLAERHGLTCPGCRQQLQDAVARLAVATGNCGLCAAAVARPDPAPRS